jgi:adenine-specific DNA-methyltransferase
MPTLDFKGKAFVHAHHLSVPFRELVVAAEKSLPAGRPPGLEGNLIIHGDNLEALKALLPVYAGKVDCIYIDPPYNTGNEGWCYNDAVRSPLMREWLKKAANPVEKEDLERHDKWLCMMWPRLQLLRELLAEDGAIFVSIDDNEVHRLRAMMDEIFGEESFYATIVWQKKYTAANDHKGISPMHDFVVVYRKTEAFDRNLLKREDGKDDQYRFEDALGVYRLSDYTCGKTADERPNLYYEIENPNTGEKTFPKRTRVWAYSPEEHRRNVERGLVSWGKDGTAKVPSFKRYKDSLKSGGGTVPSTWWDWTFAGHTDEAKKELIEIKDWEGALKTITPKPTRLIQRILEIATDKDSLILDSFAGSGTTAHAVLALNAKDGGNRRFILVETESYADTLTAERVRRVAQGYAFTGTQRTELLRERLNWTRLKNAAALVEKAESVKQLEGSHYDEVKIAVEDGALVVTGERRVQERAPGLGGSFTYCTLGAAMTLDALLADGLPTYAALAKYVFYTATGRQLPALPAKKAAAEGFIGETELYRVHLLYQPEAKWLASEAAALTEAQAERIAAANRERKTALVFAPAKFLSQRELSRHGITFCQLPYALHRLLGD